VHRHNTNEGIGSNYFPIEIFATLGMMNSVSSLVWQILVQGNVIESFLGVG
jgi:hypothetical protein